MGRAVSTKSWVWPNRPCSIRIPRPEIASRWVPPEVRAASGVRNSCRQGKATLLPRRFGAAGRTLPLPFRVQRRPCGYRAREILVVAGLGQRIGLFCAGTSESYVCSSALISMPRGCNAGLPLLRRHVLLPDVGALVGGGTLSYAHVQGRQVPVRAQLRDRALRTADADGGGTLVSVDVTWSTGPLGSPAVWTKAAW